MADITTQGLLNEDRSAPLPGEANVVQTIELPSQVYSKSTYQVSDKVALGGGLLVLVFIS